MEEQEILRPLSSSLKAAQTAATERYKEALTPLHGPNPHWDYLLDRGLREETILTNRLGVVHDPNVEHQRYEGMIAIPYLDAKGEDTLAMRFRCIEDHDHRAMHHGKYNSLAGSPSRLYNVRSIRGARDVIHLAEGEFDAMILTQEGFPAVAAPGANSWKPHHTIMLGGFEKVYIWGDPDDAGMQFAQKILASLPESAEMVQLKNGDVTDTYLSGGREALEEVLAG